ncbi:hypothetical protein GH5_06343 [Leishmania sp. Ghana 2012 LV757]|uniref:hypothetical protein n=1 Tax=Leishmania sp. Ghana 2012 LV757 TaxID=2803181 RepID=UPI001B76DDB9|nr:hypothetical protein GH5_06343 [Leishmania sp. Ghana 2012 LV757]
MMSFPRDDSGGNTFPTVRPLQHHQPQRQHPAQAPTASSREYERYFNSPRPCNPSTAPTILPNGQQQQYNLQQLPSQQKPPAVNMCTLTPASPVNVGGSPDTQFPVAPMRRQQQHDQVASSPSRHSSSADMNNPNMMQLYGRLPATRAAAGVPGLIGTAPIAASLVHRRPSALNSNSSLLLAQRLQQDFVSTSPAPMVSSTQQQQHRKTAITPFTTRPAPAHRGPPRVAAYPISPQSPVGRGSDGICSPLHEQEQQSPYLPVPMHGRVPATAPDSTNVYASSFTSSPSRSQQQQQLHLLSVRHSGAAPEVMVSFNAVTTASPSLSSPGPAAAQAMATTTSLSTFADLEDIHQAHERPFRFKMLPPPPPFERFLMLWEMNASDRPPSQAMARGEGVSSNSSRGTASAMERGNVEAMLRASTSAHAEEDDRASDGAAQCKTALTINPSDNGRMSGESHRSTPQRVAMVTQYHHILQRWWAHVVIFERKLEVRQRLGNLRLCPSFADAQRAVGAAAAPGSPVRVGSGTFDDGPADARQINELTTPEEPVAFPAPATTADPFVAEEVALQAWSTLALQWWEETKQCLRPRRSCRGAPCRGTPSTRIDDNEGSSSEMHDAASLVSVNSYEFPSTEEGHLTQSLPPPDHDALLHFDFTIQSAFSSPTDSLQM